MPSFASVSNYAKVFRRSVLNFSRFSEPFRHAKNMSSSFHWHANSKDNRDSELATKQIGTATDPFTTIYSEEI